MHRGWSLEGCAGIVRDGCGRGECYRLWRFDDFVDGVVDGVMMGKPDADPAGTAAQLEAIKAKVSTPDADLIENVAAAYSAIAADPADTEAQSKLSTSATALGAGCQTATTVPGPN